MVALARSLTTELHILLVERSRSVGLPSLAPAADAGEGGEGGEPSSSASPTASSEADKKGWARSRTTDLLVIVLRGLSYIVHHTPGQQQPAAPTVAPPRSQQGGGAKPAAPPKQPAHRKRVHGAAESTTQGAAAAAMSAAQAHQQAHGHRGNRWVCALVLDFIAETTDAASFGSEPTDCSSECGDLGGSGSSSGSGSGKLAPRSSEQLLCGLLPRALELSSPTVDTQSGGAKPAAPNPQVTRLQAAAAAAAEEAASQGRAGLGGAVRWLPLFTSSISVEPITDSKVASTLANPPAAILGAVMEVVCCLVWCKHDARKFSEAQRVAAAAADGSGLLLSSSGGANKAWSPEWISTLCEVIVRKALAREYRHLSKQILRYMCSSRAAYHETRDAHLFNSELKHLAAATKRWMPSLLEARDGSGSSSKAAVGPGPSQTKSMDYETQVRWRPVSTGDRRELRAASQPSHDPYPPPPHLHPIASHPSPPPLASRLPTTHR